MSRETFISKNGEKTIIEFPYAVEREDEILDEILKEKYPTWEAWIASNPHPLQNVPKHLRDPYSLTGIKDIKPTEIETERQKIPLMDTPQTINVKCDSDDYTNHFRLEALKLSIDMALKIELFQDKYESKEELFKDIDLVHEISDHNLKYLLGKKQKVNFIPDLAKTTARIKDEWE